MQYNQRLRLWNLVFAWIMQNAKGAPHLLNPFADFFCVPKRNSAKEKGTAARGLSRQNYRALLCNGCDSLRESGVALGATF